MEEREFAICYRKLISHLSMTPEESSRQLDEILRRIRGPDGEGPTVDEKKRET